MTEIAARLLLLLVCFAITCGALRAVIWMLLEGYEHAVWFYQRGDRSLLTRFFLRVGRWLRIWRNNR